MADWYLCPEYAHLREEFGSLEAVFNLDGERVTHDPISEVVRVRRAGVVFYVKRYRRALGWRKYLPRQRIQAEWENLEYFARWDIPTAQVIARGLQRRAGAFVRGAMITREIPNTKDLADLAHHNSPLLQDAKWVRSVSQQVADAARTMHQQRFVHNDLKWRNILVDEAGTAYFIDCPTGGFWWGPFLQYRIIKDLACLDKVGKYHLSNAQRLRFYFQYVERTRLNAQDKKQIAKIVRFFAGRE